MASLARPRVSFEADELCRQLVCYLQLAIHCEVAISCCRNMTGSLAQPEVLFIAQPEVLLKVVEAVKSRMKELHL